MKSEKVEKIFFYQKISKESTGTGNQRGFLFCGCAQFSMQIFFSGNFSPGEKGRRSERFKKENMKSEGKKTETFPKNAKTNERLSFGLFKNGKEREKQSSKDPKIF